jgi:hypothetical protein
MSDPIAENHPCQFCLQPESAHVRFDKRSNPYVVCDACGARTFLKNMRALRGFALVSPLTRDLIETLRKDQAAFDRAEQTTHAFLAGIRSKLDAASSRAPTTTTAASLAVPRTEATHVVASALPASR